MTSDVYIMKMCLFPLYSLFVRHDVRSKCALPYPFMLHLFIFYTISVYLLNVLLHTYESVYLYSSSKINRPAEYKVTNRLKKILTSN